MYKKADGLLQSLASINHSFPPTAVSQSALDSRPYQPPQTFRAYSVFKMRFASKLSILAFSGITVLAFANNPTLTGRNLNLQARDLNDLADDLYARGWADRGLHERDLLNNDYERSLDFNELELSERGLELQERAPISYTYTGGGHTATISIPTPVIIAGIAWVAGQKTWSYLMSQRGQVNGHSCEGLKDRQIS